MTGEKLLTARALAIVGNHIVYEVTFKPTVSRGKYKWELNWVES